MALPYAPTPPFAVSPFSDEEILAEQAAAQAPIPEPAFPATQPFVDQIDAEIEAELAAQEMASGTGAPADQGLDWGPSEEAQARFDALKQQMFGAQQPDELEQEMVGGPVPQQGQEFQPDVDAIAQANLQPTQTAIDGVNFPTDASLGFDAELEQGVPMAPEYAQDELEPAAEDLNDMALQMRAFEEAQEQASERQRLENEAAAADAQRKVENAQLYEQRLAEADQRSQALFEQASELARQKVDRGRYMEDKSWGQRAGMLLSVLAGGQLGLISGRGGNDAMDFFISEINRDVEEQRLNIENQQQSLSTQQGLVGQLYQQSGNAYQAAEGARLAMYEAAAAEIESQMARLNPQGIQATQKEMERRKLLAVRDQQRAKMAADARKAALDEAKFELDARDKLSQIDKRSAEIAKMQAEAEKLARRGTGGPKPLSLRDAEFALSKGMVQDVNGNWVRDPNFTGVPMDPKEAAELAKAQAQATEAQRAVGGETLGVPGVVDSKGEPILFQDKATAIEVAKGIGTTRFAIDVYDDLLLAIEKHGWSSDTLRSPEWQRANVNAGELTVLFKEMGKHGALSGSDIDLVNKQSGTQGDVTGVRDPTEGLLQARENLLKRQNHNIKALREDAQPIDIPRKKAPPKPKQKTPTEQYEIVSAPVAAHLAGEDGQAQDIANRRQVATEALARAKGPGSKYLVAANMRQDLRKAVEAGTIPAEVAWSTVAGSIMQEEAKVLAKNVMSEYKDAKKAGDPNAPSILKRAEDLKWLGGGGGTPREAWEILNSEDAF